MVKVIFEEEKCIGCGSCSALCPKFWEMGTQGKACLKKAKKNSNTKKQELEIDKIDCNKEAADNCPAQCIHII